MAKKTKETNKFRRIKLKIEDEVVVIAGKEKGKRGKIMHIDKARGRVFVQGLNRVSRFQRPTQENPQGGVIEVESPIDISNVMFYDSKLKRGVRLGNKRTDSGKVRLTRPEGKEV